MEKVMEKKQGVIVVKVIYDDPLDKGIKPNTMITGMIGDIDDLVRKANGLRRTMRKAGSKIKINNTVYRTVRSGEDEYMGSYICVVPDESNRTDSNDLLEIHVERIGELEVF